MDRKRLDDPGEDIIGFYAVLSITFIFLHLNCLGNIYIFWRTFIKWKKRSPLETNLLFPFYTAITGEIAERVAFMLFAVHEVNMIYLAIKARPLDKPVCTIVGAFITGTEAAQMALACTMAVSTYLRVCKQKEIDPSYNYHKLFLIMFFAAVIAIAIEFRELGPAKYWCAAARFAPCIVLVLSTATFVVTLFCYVKVIRSVVSARVNIEAAYSDELANRQNLEAIVAKKISSYLLIYLLQWIPIMVYDIGLLAGSSSRWFYICAGIGLNLGGIGNSIQYAFNEGALSRDSESS
ncbi:10564_t:CDS:2 [Paraglomus brasilianum]|uniref:10564_t:CDS:1 n=1 Tax=Paraglomus brasilianum TaxID=144538 RepID=A0A9N9AVK9_9GLOM|nr:10564_t:CDS:2 [Paraglomus brasilianum]